MPMLKDYPRVMNAFHSIELDNGGTRARWLNPDIPIPEHWETPFQLVEAVFNHIGDAKMSDLPDILQKQIREEVVDDVYDPTTPVWEIIALPVNDAHVVVMDGLGINKTDQWLTNHLLYQFFDGELAGVFVTKRRH